MVANWLVVRGEAREACWGGATWRQLEVGRCGLRRLIRIHHIVAPVGIPARIDNACGGDVKVGFHLRDSIRGDCGKKSFAVGLALLRVTRGVVL